ncbi:MAG: PBP1A family penicillin-binding protein [Candidatus Dependentiae bacterium]|nr:PBP1A family penicillin-binding protein [Candidatus Dependentiae bacterium]
MKSILNYLFITFILVSSCLLGACFYIVYNHSVDFSVLEQYDHAKPSIVLDDEGHEWARFQLDKREPIALYQMPPHLIHAFIAAEDWNFFNHAGISWRGIIRSTLVNLYHRRKVQGASTITQQLVKLLFFDSKKTFERKIKEQLLALLVERQFTKEQILETYLNHVCFGCGIYGVQAASQRFWKKNAADISPAQAATLAAIVRSPAHYCPLVSAPLAEKRRNIILHSMMKLSFITHEAYEQARNKPLEVIQDEQDSLAPHLRETIRLHVEGLFGREMLYGGGLHIKTTLNKNIQQKATKAFRDQCLHLKNTLASDIDGALISIEAKTGQIKALIGGHDFSSSKFNRALQARRQIGSTIKPLIYAAALQAGMSFADVMVDEPYELLQQNGTMWQPNNYNKQFDGPITLAHALSHSNNIVAIKTLLAVGAQPVIGLARACNMTGPFHSYPSLALGCVDGSLYEVTGMFNIFANNGEYVEPHYLTWIKDAWGTKIWKSKPQHRRVMSSRVSGQVVKVLTHSLERVRWYWPTPWLDCEALSKTGTTNDSRTCWFAGSTPELTTVVYIGRDDNRSMGENIYPVKTAFPIWMQVHSGLPSRQKQFAYDPSLKELRINEKTGAPVYGASVPGTLSIMV